MGINTIWQEDVFLTVKGFHHQAEMVIINPYFIIDTKKEFLIHLIPLDNNFTSTQLLNLQTSYKAEGKQLVQLWEDVWLAKREQVLSRFNSFLGLNKGFHGRKAKIKEIDFKQASIFLNINHLQGYVKAKYNFGLFNGEELIAVASFSQTRPMKNKGEIYVSAELVRFASKEGITIVGGLSKFIKNFLKKVKVNDLMTYADRDWSLGKGYEKIGFTFSNETDSLNLYVNTASLIRYTVHRLPKSLTDKFKSQNALNSEDFLAHNHYKKVFNTGNLKYHLFLSNA